MPDTVLKSKDEECLTKKSSKSRKGVKNSTTLSRKNILMVEKKKKRRHKDVFQYEENEIMTCFDGYWVLRTAVDKLKQQITDLSIRTDLNHLARQRAAKKLKRVQHSNLLRYLSALHNGPAVKVSGNSDRVPQKLSDSQCSDTVITVTSLDLETNDGTSVENQLKTISLKPNAEAAKCDASANQRDNVNQSMTDKLMAIAEGDVRRKNSIIDAPPREKHERRVKFDGVWMTAEAVGRLKTLRQHLRRRKLDKKSTETIMKGARRREETRCKRLLKKRCLYCRGAGHSLTECPKHKAQDADSSNVFGLCFRCGSTEHALSACRSTNTNLPYAACFVCGENGHLSRDCALNARGVYPRGGSCRVCGQRSHLARDCPEQKNTPADADRCGALKTVSEARLQLIGSGGIEDDYEQDFNLTETTVNPANSVRIVPVREARTVAF